MEQDNTAGQQAAIPSTAELELRHYEARLGFWKVFWGTFIVGLAGITIPGVISLFTVYSENKRDETELRLSQEAAHQQYIKDFFSTAINQDIELRIRFAEYFTNLSGPGQEMMWKKYLDSLKRHCQIKNLAIYQSTRGCRKSQVFCAFHRQPGITNST